MSDLACTPERLAALERIKRNQALRPEEKPWVPLEKSTKELDLLIEDFRKSPTLEKIKAYFILSTKVARMTGESLARTLQSLSDQELCETSAPAAREEEEEKRRLEVRDQRLAEISRKKSIVVAEQQALHERLQKRHAANERLILSLGIPTRRDSEGDLVCCYDKCNTSTT